MPSGPMSTMTSAATVVPAPPGVFATSMPPELPGATSPVSSAEDRESISSNEGHRKHSMVNGGNTPLIPPTFSPSSSQFVIDPTKNSTSPPNKLRKKIKSSRNRLQPPNGIASPVNKPLKVTIRRTAGHSHTLDASEQDRRLSPSSVYSSVPGDDEKSPILPSGLADSLNPELRNRTASPISEKEKLKPVDYFDERPHRRDASTSTVDCGTSTEPDLLGPCEPGSKIVLEGVVWLETPGMMVINAHWRGKAYLGTLLDASKNTLGPSCPDKMITSLSMVKSRPNWGAHSHSSSGLYRNSVNSASSSNLTSGGTMKTRSANATTEDGASRRRGFHASRGRKRRRGGAAQTPAAAASPSAAEEQDDETPTPSDTPSAPEFACPQPGCEKRFSDILGVRFHLDMSHGHQQEEQEKQEGQTEEKKQQCQPSEPPRLAKVKSTGSTMMLDEDQPPPQLDRGPPADEEVVAQTSCEPPAASPAYSDISDDGPAPQKSRISSSGGQVTATPWAPAPPIPVVTVSQQQAPPPQPMDWSNRRLPAPPGKSPYDFSAQPPPPPTSTNGLNLSSFGAAATGGSPYHPHHHSSHHHHRQPPPLHVPPSSSAAATNELLQARIANLMAAGASPKGCPPQQLASRQSPQSIPSGIHPYRPQ